MELLKRIGPLSDEELQAICINYGLVDERYTSLEFCRIVFNENPSGYSFHVFVLNDKKEVVGHCSVVPIRIEVGKKTMLSGKGEALFLADSYRNTTVEYKRTNVPTGIGLIHATHDLAESNGISVIHNFTRTDVGMILRMSGFRQVQITRDTYYFVIDYKRLNAFQVSRKRKLMGSLLQWGNWFLHRYASIRLGRKVVNSIQVTRGLSEDSQLQSVNDSGQTNRWQISTDQETLRWYERMDGFLCYIAPDDSRLIVRSLRGHTSIVSMSLGGSVMHKRALLVRAVKDAIKANQISFVVAAETLQEQETLNTCIKRLGFIMHPFSANLLIKSNDAFFYDVSNIHYNTFFNL